MMADRGPRFRIPGQFEFKKHGCQSEVAMAM